jgi:hypothetical protein
MTTDETIAKAMSRAFFASAYAEQYEEADEPGFSMSGRDYMDVLPDETDPAAHHAAFTLACDLRIKNAAPTLGMLFDKAKDIGADGDRPLTPDMFGHYLAMQAMGHGVGLRDAFGSAVYDAIRVPYVEFGSHSLERDYFA